MAQRELTSLALKLKPEQFVTLCKCVLCDFMEFYEDARDFPEDDHSEQLDRMEADYDLLEATLPAIASEETEFEIRKTLSMFKSKIAEVSEL